MELDRTTMTMAEDQCLIQYVRDNFGHEFTQSYVNIDSSFGLDYNTFTESSAFADPSGSPVTTLAPDLFGSPSPSIEVPGSTMEGSPGIPYLEAATGCYSPPGEPGLQVPSVLNNLHRPLLNEKEYPMLASYGLARPEEECFEMGISLDEMLQEQFAKPAYSEGCDRATGFWKGKTPALLMQQLKGPSLTSPSSSSSEARSNLKSPSFQQAASPRTPLNLTTLSNRGVGDVKSYTFGAAVEPGQAGISKSVRRQRSLPPLGDINSDLKYKSNILSPGSRSTSRVLQSSCSFKGDGDIRQRRKIMPGLALLGEMQRNAASNNNNNNNNSNNNNNNNNNSNCNNNNNSWSCSSTSPGPASDGKEFLAAHFDLLTSSVPKNNYDSSMSPAMSMGGDRMRKKAKAAAELGSAVTEDAVQAAILATAMVEQKEKQQLREKFLALLQIDSSTAKDYKAQILDDTIRYLKDLRWRLNFNEADSTPHSKRIPEPSFPTDESTEASPTTTSSRWQPYSEGLASPVRLQDLELETAGVEISPHLTVDTGPHIEVRMMENQHVMVKLTAMDRPGLLNDIVVVLQNLRLDIQHANIRTGNNGRRKDIFAAKMQLPWISNQSTHSIAMALNEVISASSLSSPEPLTPQI